MKTSWKYEAVLGALLLQFAACATPEVSSNLELCGDCGELLGSTLCCPHGVEGPRKTPIPLCESCGMEKTPSHACDLSEVLRCKECGFERGSPACCKKGGG